MNGAGAVASPVGLRVKDRRFAFGDEPNARIFLELCESSGACRPRLERLPLQRARTGGGGRPHEDPGEHHKNGGGAFHVNPLSVGWLYCIMLYI